MKLEAEVDEFIKLIMQFKEAMADISELSKKKPNDAVNKFKLNFVNTLLTTANKFIDDKNKPFEDFDVFNIDDLPSNSDVVMVFSQYLACLKKYGKEQIQYFENSHYWIVDGKRSNIRANREMLN